MSKMNGGMAVVVWSLLVILLVVLFRYANIATPVEFDLPLRSGLSWNWPAWLQQQPSYLPFYLGMVGFYAIVVKVHGWFSRQR